MSLFTKHFIFLYFSGETMKFLCILLTFLLVAGIMPQAVEEKENGTDRVYGRIHKEEDHNGNC